MKKIKKCTVSLASAAAFLAAYAAMTASAASINAYSVSYETLTAAITTEDGSTVPAGSVAVTMSIDNNTGFNANTMTLDIDAGYSVVTNASGKPIVEKGAVLAGALTSAAVSDNGETLCVVSASAAVSSADGALFTVFFTADAANTQSGFVSIDDTEPAVATGEISITPYSTIIYDSYFIGDTNGEDWKLNSAGDKYAPVDAVDAANIMMACYYYGNSINLLSVPDSVIEEYFPDVKHRGALDVNGNNVCDNIDANEILDYSAIIGAGNTYDGDIGKQIIFIKEIID